MARGAERTPAATQDQGTQASTPADGSGAATVATEPAGGSVSTAPGQQSAPTARKVFKKEELPSKLPEILTPSAVEEFINSLGELRQDYNELSDAVFLTKLRRSEVCNEATGNADVRGVIINASN